VGDASVGIKIEATRHDTQDDDFATGINQCLNKDGSNTATANLPMGGFKHTNCANATSNNEYATFGQLQTVMPSGAITAYGAATAPSGWLLCNGASVSTTTYASLHAIIGYTYGGSGASFNLPDLQQKFPLGKAASGTGATLGGSGGAIDHTHSVPAHYHGVGSATTAYSGSHGHIFSGTIGGADGLHGHTTVEGRDSDSGTAPIDNIRITGGGATLYTSATLIRDTGSGHGHGVGSLAASGGDHSHGLAGSVGNTGGSNGDAAFTSGANNPPFLVVNYIIKT
jgi:microcystin-dependent protein